jgi:hypothetical protein
MVLGRIPAAFQNPPSMGGKQPSVEIREGGYNLAT